MRPPFYIPFSLQTLTRLMVVLSCTVLLNLETLAQSQKPTPKPKYEYSTPALKAAEALYTKKKYPEALASFEAIIEKALAAENYEEVVYAMEKKAWSLRRLDNYDNAIVVMDKAIELALEKLPERHLLASRMYYTRGTLEHSLRNFYLARDYFDTTMIYYANANTYDSRLHYRIVEYKYYAYQYSEGNQDTLFKYLNILFHLESSKPVSELDHNKILTIMRSYPTMYSQTGDYDRALIHAIQAYKYALAHREDISDRYYIEVFLHLGKVLYKKGEYATVLKLMNKVMPLVESAPRNQIPEYPSFHNMIGATYMSMGQYERAITSFKIALQEEARSNKSIDDGERSKGKSRDMMNLAICYMLLGKNNLSKSYFENSLKEIKRFASVPNQNISFLYNKIGNFYLKQNNWQSALMAYDSALRNGLRSYTSSIDSFPIGNDSYSYDDLITLSAKTKSLLNVAMNSKDSIHLIKSSEIYAEKTHTLIMENKEDFLASEGKLKLSSDFKSLYQTGVRASFELYQRTNDTQYLDKGLTHMSRGKSQLFLEQMGDLQALRGRDAPEEMRLAFGLASQKIDSLDIEISALLVDPLDQKLPPVLEERIQWSDKLDSLKQQVALLYKAPEKDISVDIIRGQYGLNNEKAFIEFIDGDSLIFAIGVSGDKTSFRKIAKDEPFKASLNQLLKEVSVAPKGKYAEHLKNFGQSANLLYQSLIAPIMEDLGSVRELIIVPDGELTKIPFDLLVSDWNGHETSFKALDYLMKKVDITHLLSSKIEFEEQDSRQGKGILGFGYLGEGFTDERAEMGSLPGALEEIDFLKAKFEGDYFIGEKGTKQQFLKQADDYDVIHLAIHGKSDSVNRFKSSLVFNGEKDYYLTSTDLYQTNLQSKLAVLSACETSVGQFSKGEGTFSIARGFAIAGVPAIVTTLWKVNDAAGAKITQRFYQGLEQGLKKDKALKNAKMAFLEQSNNITESPFYWGNYVLIGDPVAIELKKKSSPFQWMLITSVLLLIMGAAVLRRKRLSHAA